MKPLTQTTTINKPPQEVFDFCINPENTPKWVGAITQEQSNEWPVRLGTVYRNQRQDGSWSEYEVIGLKPNELFTIRQKDDGFSVKYVFTPVGDSATKLEYSVWKDNGELSSSLTEEVLGDMLGKLKEVIEAKA